MANVRRIRLTPTHLLTLAGSIYILSKAIKANVSVNKWIMVFTGIKDITEAKAKISKMIKEERYLQTEYFHVKAYLENKFTSNYTFYIEKDQVSFAEFNEFLNIYYNTFAKAMYEEGKFLTFEFEVSDYIEKIINTREIWLGTSENQKDKIIYSWYGNY